MWTSTRRPTPHSIARAYHSTKGAQPLQTSVRLDEGAQPCIARPSEGGFSNRVTPGHRLITASDPNLLRAWDLKPTPLASELITDYAKLLSGRKLNAGGVMLALKPDELAELNRSLRTRAPQLFE